MSTRAPYLLLAAWLGALVVGPTEASADVVVLAGGGALRLVVPSIEGPNGSEIALEEAARGLDISFSREGRDAKVTLKSGGREVMLENGKSLFSASGQLKAMAAPVRVVGERTWVSPSSAATVLGAALGQPATYRSAYRALIIGAYEGPRLRVTNAVSAAAVESTVGLSKAVPFDVRREPNRVVVTFQADVMEADFISEGLPGRIVSSAAFERTNPPRLVFELGDRFGALRVADRSSQSLALVFEPLAPGSVAPAPGTGAPSLPARPGARARGNPGFQRPIVLVIDPGHGGADVGAKGPKGRFEKDVTLALARRLRAAAVDSLAIQAFLTRDADSDLPLDERAAIANNFNADIFISLHANGSRIASASGTEVFFLSYTAVDDEARRIAVQEGSIPEQAGAKDSDVGLILWDMAQAAQLSKSSTLAADLYTEIADAELSRSRGVKQAPFRVLVGATMPAALVEVGFITNPDEEKLLFSDAHQARLVDALIEGLRRFIATLRANP